MAFQINTNVGALKAYNALAKVNAQAQKAQLRLATGSRINEVQTTHLVTEWVKSLKVRSH
jgi:hypothetical protein